MIWQGVVGIDRLVDCPCYEAVEIFFRTRLIHHSLPILFGTVPRKKHTI